VRAVGPVAYALALIASGRADAMWSRSSKAEWDVAAGAALIAAAGGSVTAWDGAPPIFNRWPPRLSGLLAAGAPLMPAARAFAAAPVGR
jgi:myo-inositol-1(or 4)-monophosphatase